MGIEVRVADRGYDLSLGVYLFYTNAQGRPEAMIRLVDGAFTVETIPLEGQMAVAIEPSFVLDEAFARALCDTLVNRFNGSEDTRQLRKDYEHEKQRVDKFIDRLLQVST